MRGATLLHVLKLKTWQLASDLAIKGMDLIVSNTPNESYNVPLSSFKPPLSPNIALTRTVKQPPPSILRLKLLDPRSTGAGLRGYSPQALDAETGEASRHTCRITTPPFLTLT